MEGRSIRGLGEIAAIEALARFVRASPDATALLLLEGTDVERRRSVIDDRFSLIGTGNFHRELERAGLIQSADHILDLASEGGRDVVRQRKAAGDEAARAGSREQARDRE